MSITTVIILLAGGTMLALGLFMAYILGWANKAFHVEIDPKQEAVLEALPGANCGGCGYVGCNEYAEAVVAGDAPPTKCPVGGTECAAEIAKILGLEISDTHPERPIIHCGANYHEKLGRHEYHGEMTCVAANFVAGFQGCAYGCLSLGDCVKACEFDAIHVIDGRTQVDYEKCVGCGACVKACPRGIITMEPFKADRILVVACSNKDFGKAAKDVCKVGCTGCKLCQKQAPDLITVEDNIPTIDYKAYNPDEMEPADAAANKCPMKCLIMAGKEIRNS